MNSRHVLSGVELAPKTPYWALVDVYWNRTSSCFSVRLKASQRVVGHASAINLIFVTLNVGEKSRKRQLETGHRTVHAWLTGLVFPAMKPNVLNRRMVYNPFKHSSFVDLEEQVPLYSVSLVSCNVVNGKPVIQYKF